MKNHFTLYISGPMTGLPGYNFQAFHDAHADLQRAGFDVLNPALNEPASGDAPREHYMRLDIAHVMKADGIALLDGWIRSEGAQTEVRVAQELALPVAPLGHWLSVGINQLRMQLAIDAMEKFMEATERPSKENLQLAGLAYRDYHKFPGNLESQRVKTVKPLVRLSEVN